MELADKVGSSRLRKDNESLAAAHLQCVQICTETHAPKPNTLLKSRFPFHIRTHTHLWHTKTHTRTCQLHQVTGSCALTSIIPIPADTHTHSTYTILCLKWQQGAELLFAFPIARVFVWFHAYCAVIEHSDPSAEGGLLTNRLHSRKTQALSGVDAVFWSYTRSLCARVGADEMKASSVSSGFPLQARLHRKMGRGVCVCLCET